LTGHTLQLLDSAVLAIFATALFVSGGLAVLATIVVRLVQDRGAPPAQSRRAARSKSPGGVRLTTNELLLFCLAITTFSMLGFVTGDIMGQSRDAAVGAVLPAVLTLLGGVTIYIMGSKGVETQARVSAMVLCFSIALLAGSLYGATLRVAFDGDRSRMLQFEDNRNAVEVQQLLNYIEVLKLERELGNNEKLDLSHFKSALERDESAKLPASSESAKASLTEHK
jgi:hypothetical protein